MGYILLIVCLFISFFVIGITLVGSALGNVVGVLLSPLLSDTDQKISDMYKPGRYVIDKIGSQRGDYSMINNIEEYSISSIKKASPTYQEQTQMMIAMQSIAYLLIVFFGFSLFVFCLFSSTKWSIISALLFLLGVGMLIYRTVVLKIRNKYVMLVDQGSSSTNIDWIASQMSKSYEKVATDLQKMINMGYFGDAFIDYKNGMIVLDKAEYKTKTTLMAAELAQCLDDNILTDIPNPVLDAKYKTIREKYGELKHNATKNKEIDRIKRLYLRRVETIIRKYSNAPLRDDELVNKINELLDCVINMLDASAGTFSERKRVDIDTDIEALYNKLLADGYSNSDKLLDQ